MPADWAGGLLDGFVVGVAARLRTRRGQVRLLNHLLCSLDEGRVIHHCPPTLLQERVARAVAGAGWFGDSHRGSGVSTVRPPRVSPVG